MAWRSVVITNPARLKFKNRALLIEQGSDCVSVPLEDIATLVIDCPQVTLTSQLLSACASQQIAVITVDETHTPNGVMLPFLPHTRALRVMRRQLAMTAPQRKRLWQSLVRQKLLNQSQVLAFNDQEQTADHLYAMAGQVRSGDPDNYEAQGAQLYFPALFGSGFTRNDEEFINGALNYGYSIIRSALARALVGYGFLPAFGLHHRSEQNSFNLADDLIEPYRPLVDNLVTNFAAESHLGRESKAKLVSLLHQDAPRVENDTVSGKSTVLALVDATVISLARCVEGGEVSLTLPGLPNEP